ncbi:MAG: hypothetical protein GEV07_16430 [Streptosporangiales bacterium]|nr:hypothetical protein [Streptosporangiales bacterium]
MAAAGGIIGLLLGLVMMAIGLVVMYFIVKAAVKNGVLEALDDPRATVGTHRLITQLRGGAQQQVPGGNQQLGQYPPQ